MTALQSLDRLSIGGLLWSSDVGVEVGKIGMRAQQCCTATAFLHRRGQQHGAVG